MNATLDLLVRATMLVAGASLAARALTQAGASAAARHLAWLLGIAALLLFPLLAALLPALPLAILSASAPPAFSGPPTPGGTAIASFDWAALTWPVYLGIAGLLVARLLAGHAALARIWAAADPADAEWQGLVDRLAAGLGVRPVVRLRLARGSAMPMTWGALAPRIVLPGEARLWSAERRTLVLLHELAHVARRDSLSRSAASIACALYWFHPGVWFMARRMRIEQEHASDDRALLAGVAARSYARNLLDLAGRLDRPGRALPAAAMARASQLERRLLAIVGRGSRRAPGSAFAGASVAVALAAAWFVATAVPVGAIQLPPAAPAPPAWPLARLAPERAAAPRPVRAVPVIVPIRPIAARADEAQIPISGQQAPLIAAPYDLPALRPAPPHPGGSHPPGGARDNGDSAVSPDRADAAGAAAAADAGGDLARAVAGPEIRLTRRP